MGRATSDQDGGSTGAGAASFSILEGVAIMGAGGGWTGVVVSFFCRLVLTDGMVGGGAGLWGYNFFCELGLFKMPGSPIRIVRLIITRSLGRISYPETQKLGF